MRRSVRNLLGLSFIAILSLSFTSLAFAEASSSEHSVTGFFRRLFNYPVKAVKETAGMTANTVQNAGEKMVEPMAENTAAVVTGSVEKTGDMVVKPAMGAMETVGQTASETAQMPIKAAEEEKPAAEATK